MTTPPIQWYPGIAKPSRRNSSSVWTWCWRCEMPGSHSNSSSPVAEWVGSRYCGAEPGGYAPSATVGEVVQGAEGGAFFCNAQDGKGVAAVAQAALRAGVELNQRRRDRGMLPVQSGCSHWVSQCRQISINQPSVETASSGKCCSSWRNAAALDTHL